MAWYWYIATRWEVFGDLDHKNPELPAFKLKNCLERLQGLIDSDRLNLDEIEAYLFPSTSARHYHFILKLSKPVSTLERIIKEMYLRDDPFRVLNNLMRLHLGITGSLLITNKPYEGFYRKYDYRCNCKSKHTHAVMKKCPIARQLRKDSRATDYFGKPAKRAFPLKFGKLNLCKTPSNGGNELADEINDTRPERKKDVPKSRANSRLSVLVK